ncbi:site-specific integrase [Pseudoduganella aquatica]|uniref:site-specific integrase n=1 Tax=Pseudoduganella aquatica TaxID=2660641 RepID=UPI001E38E9F1|nr:site-specific integrase [Pseudoduganella aquatica]
MSDVDLPDLTVRIVPRGTREAPCDLRCLLYRGGAGANAAHVDQWIADGRLGSPLSERFELVRRVHAEISGALAAGWTKSTAKGHIHCLRRFFAWVDDIGESVRLESVTRAFILWSDHLLHRQHVVRDLRQRGVYQMAKSVAHVLDKVLDRHVSILVDTRIRKAHDDRQSYAAKTDKQDLAQSFVFGYGLVDICDALTVAAIHGPLPLRIAFRSKQVIEYWSYVPHPDTEEPVDAASSQHCRPPISESARTAWACDPSPRMRTPLVNLRIEAELLLFIAQTGMSLAQAHTMRIGHFHYTSHFDGYQVRRYKQRRQGEVEFDIYHEYRAFFERYLAWRSAMFPDDPDGLLFPFVRREGTADTPLRFSAMRAICGKLGMAFIPPRALRKIRINWLLRESQDPALTSEMAQHAERTLLRDYAEPHPQIAMVEITRFHQRTDPNITPPGPGRCVEPTPEALPNIPAQAASPDCVSPAGCLFCAHQRDIDSEDHVWSLASFRHLKSLELARDHPARGGKAPVPPHPAELAVDRLTAKLALFEGSSDVRRLWVGEARARIAEGDYHPAWDGYIRLTEIRT